MSKATYADTLNRFNAILTDKLGETPKVPAMDKLQTKVNPNVSERVMKAEDIISDVSTRSTGSSAIINRYFAGTKLSGLGNAFEKAGEKYGVNPIFLASIAALESGYGESKIARDKNNLFGYGAYDEDPYKYAKSFSTVQNGIDIVASKISEDYLDEAGKYYNGKTTEGVNVRYATDKEWHNKIDKIIRNMMNK